MFPVFGGISGATSTMLSMALPLGPQSEAGWANPRNYGGTDHLAAAAMDCANGFA